MGSNQLKHESRMTICRQEGCDWCAWEQLGVEVTFGSAISRFISPSSFNCFFVDVSFVGRDRDSYGAMIH